jgi:hypothetical protein
MKPGLSSRIGGQNTEHSVFPAPPIRVHPPATAGKRLSAADRPLPSLPLRSSPIKNSLRFFCRCSGLPAYGGFTRLWRDSLPHASSLLFPWRSWSRSVGTASEPLCVTKKVLCSVAHRSLPQVSLPALLASVALRGGRMVLRSFTRRRMA